MLTHLLASALLLVTAAHAQVTPHYVNDPANCPQEDDQFLGQRCPGIFRMCGVNNDLIPQCYDPSQISAPSSTESTNSQTTSSLGGGYILDCFAYPLDSAAPYCDDDGTAICNRDDSCFLTKKRTTVCTADVFGQFTCGDCNSGMQDCAGDDVCEVTTGVTNFPTGANNNYGASCAAQCDSGYLDCDSGGAGLTNGCEIQNGASCETGAVYSGCSGSNGNCVCSSGYNDCDGNVGTGGNGCEIQDNTSCGTNSIYNGCSGADGNCVCSSGYLDCDSGGPGLTNGCEIQDNASCGTNASYNGCDSGAGNCECNTGYFDCDASGAGSGNGCEVQSGTACTTAQGIDGTYTGCTCVTEPVHFITGVDAVYSTGHALLDGTQLGTGDLIEMANSNGVQFRVTNSGAIQIGYFEAGSGTGAGMIRWTGVDFEGYNGSEWLSLTSGSGGSGISQSVADDRYVNIDGDTMTGDLEIEATLSGRTIEGFGLTDCDGASDILQYDAATQKFTCGTDGGVNVEKNQVFHAQFPGASYKADGANNVGQLVVEHDTSAFKNYYLWTTTRSTLNDYDVIFRFTLPDDFTSWKDKHPVSFEHRGTTANASNNSMDVVMYDTNNTQISLSGSVENLASTVWQEEDIEFLGSPTWTAGGDFTIKFHMSAKDQNECHLSTVKLNYNVQEQ